MGGSRALHGPSSVLEGAGREAAEREVWTCKATLDAVTEVVLVLKIVLCGAHRVPAKCSKRTARWAGAAARAGGAAGDGSKRCTHIQCEVTMCDSADIRHPHGEVDARGG